MRGRRSRLWVSRRTVDAGPVALRGELAHEHAHLIDPNHWRDTIIALVVWSAFSLLAVAGWTTPILLSGTRPDEISIVGMVTLWVGGWLCLACGCWLLARITHRRELRADRVAAQLLGSVGPVLVMIERVLVVDRQRSRLQRAFARLTHPDPEERREALVALALDEPADPSVVSP